MVTSPRMARTSAGVDVSERPHADVELLVAPRAKLIGRVLDQNDQPVGAAVVSQVSSHAILRAALTETTNAEVRFVYDGLPLKSLRYPFSASAAGF